MKLALITWRDASEEGTGWVHAEDIKFDKDLTMFTIGRILKNNTDRVIVAGSWAPDDSMYGDITHIPKKMVVDIKPL